jgi:hypothetical protein
VAESEDFMKRELASCMGGFLLLSAACSSTPQPTERLASAEAAVRASEELGANRVPQAQLHRQLAEEEIARARKQIKDGDNDLADLTLQRAKADAELSVALARQEQMRTELQGPSQIDNAAKQR